MAQGGQEVAQEGQEVAQGGREVNQGSQEMNQGGQEIVHQQLLQWPNYGVVESVAELGEFVRAVYDEQGGRGDAMVVHCSGGVGRSGAFTTVYCLYRLVLEARELGWGQVEEHLGPGEEVCLVALVRRLRETRHPWMVEGAHQYKLAYATLLALLQGMLDEGK